MMRPVGVGFTSRGPIGAEGLTITAGKPVLLDHVLDESFGEYLALLVGADGVALRERRSSSAGAPSRDASVATLLV